MQLQAGAGLQKSRGTLAVFVMLCAAAAVALLASSGKAGKVGLAMTQADADQMFRNSNKYGDYTEWEKTIDDINHEGKVNHGLWTPYKGPPFMERMVLFSGNDVDVTQSGNLVRMVMGLKKNFGKWEGNGYLKSFEGPQMRFVQSNENSILVIPPVTDDNMPTLTPYARKMLRHYISKGNSVIVCGGPASIDFVNQNFLELDGNMLLQPAWTRGPYERQVVSENTPFQTLPITLPNVNNHAHGVRTQSLPPDAKSYFEVGEGSPGGGVSQVFSLPLGKGQMLYIGYDYSKLSEEWVKTLIAGLEFAGKETESVGAGTE
jgi:hypothetical protein